MSVGSAGTVASPFDDWRRELGQLGDLPAWAVDVFGLLTYLGDTRLLLVLVVLTYLAYDRRAGGFVGGTVFVGLATTAALKAWFALPRPPVELRHVVITGFGFPSGHAVGSTVTWGALVLALEGVSTARRRAAIAAVVVVAVAASRIVLRVHYLVDVVAGVAIGLVVLAVAARWFRDAPLGLFGMATAVALGAVVLPRSGWHAVALLGATIGASTAWQLAVPADRPWGRRGVVAAGGAGGLVAVALAVVDTADSLVFVGAALAAFAVIGWPAISHRWPDEWRGAPDGRTRG